MDVQLYGPATQLSCVLDGGEAFNCKYTSKIFMGTQLYSLIF